jgi:PAT family beta-lactamase induction signal transducer AmpG
MSTQAVLADVPRAREAASLAPTAPWRWIGTLYFAEGLPATVVGTVSAIVLKQLGVPNEQIALSTSAFALPWILRPLWSPLLEVFGTRRSFVLGCEILIAVALAATAAGLGLESRIPLLMALLGIVAIAAATHDMAADGLYLHSMSSEAQARYVGWLSVAFIVAKMTAQGLLVVLVGILEPTRGALVAWQIAFASLATLTAALAFYHAQFLPRDTRTSRPEAPASALTSTFSNVLVTFFRKPGILVLVSLIVLYRLVEGQLTRIVPLFLLDAREQGGLGLTTAELGASYGGFGVAGFMAGALLGSWLSARLGRRRAIFALCLAFNLPVFFYLALAWGRPRSLALVSLAIVLEQVVYGIGFVGLKLVAFALARGPYETAHFALATGLSGVGAVVAGMFSGALQSTLGYPAFFACAALSASLPILAAAVCSRQG